MNKLLIEVSSPAAKKTFDMFVYDSLQIGELALLAGNLFMQASEGDYSHNGSYVICEKESGYILDCNKTLKESKIQNGARIILF